jgi:hypothetical protein
VDAEAAGVDVGVNEEAAADVDEVEVEVTSWR